VNFVTVADLSKDVLKLIPFCIEKDISAIYGVPRSGMLPATLLATALQLPLGIAGQEAVIGRRVKAKPRKHDGPALLIDDSVNNAGSIKKASAAMKVPHLKACVYAAREVPVKYVKILAPRLFEWNIFNCERKFMYDMDGVLCQEPGVIDNDGPEYEKAIRNAKPKYLTTWPVEVATNRIERWRPLTEDWLKRHGVECSELHMQPFQSAAERRKNSTPHQFKAEQYQKSSAEMFIESSDAQAKEIHSLTQKPVLSVEKMKLYE
jgi:hypothetical protein